MRSKKWASFFVFALVLMNGSIVQAHEIIPTLSIGISQFDQDIVDPNWGFVNVSDSGPLDLGIYQFSSAPQSSGRGRQDRINLTMRRSPRVNQEVLPRATFLG